MRKIYIVIGIIIIVAIGVFFLFQNNSKRKEQLADACRNAPVATSSATIVYSDSGFSPAVSSISSGGSLTVKNESGSAVQFDSDPHPIHTDNADLNVGQVASGGQKSVTINKTGCFSFHNHLNPSDTGKILVK